MSSKYDAAPSLVPGEITITLAEYTSLLRDRENLRQLEESIPAHKKAHWKPAPKDWYWSGI